MKRLALKVLLLIILPLALLELGSRAWPDRPTWYRQVDSELRDDETNIFFVGSSRTLAAVDASALTTALSQGAIPHAHVYNLGGPYSTMAQHFLGLRNLANNHPAALRNSYWVLETLNGLPEYRESWTDSWANPDHKEMLLTVLRPQDVPRFWAAPGLSLFDKVYVVTALYSRIPRWYLDTRTWLIATGETAVDRAIRRWRRTTVPPDTGVSTGTPVRADEAGIQFARQLALAFAAAARARPEVPYADWTDQIVHDWLLEVRHAGGRAFFFDVPLSSVQAEAYLTPIRQRDSRRLAEIARSWGLQGVLPLKVATTDEDFPDLIHVRASRRAEFTAALTSALAAWRPE
jgi:hypothetical protein